LLGVPGPSSALFVARRFGLPEPVVERARELLPAHAIDRELVVRKLELERAELEQERAELRSELERQAILRGELEQELDKIDRAERSELARESRELIALVQRARAEVREARQRLKETDDASELRAIERDISRAAAHVAVGGTVEQTTRSGGPAAKPDLESLLVPGTAVRLRNAGTLAVVEALPERGQVRLRAGSLKLTLPVSEIESVQGRPRPVNPPTPRREKPKSGGALATAVRSSDNTLDLRGERVDEAITRVDAFLSQLLGEGQPLGFVLHGHGTGALKSAVREHLTSSRYVAHCRAAESDEGGDAFTIFWLS
jgi:DNA mismatch repair protein MutS2